jgi:cytochrome c oxidase subunit 3
MAHRITDANGNHHAFHFNNAEHEFEASKFGVWIFLCTEILMFGGLFVGYIAYSGLYPEIFEAGSQFLDWKLGALNTVVLLFSSFTIAVSIRNLQMNEQKKAFNNLLITFLCGLGFMGIKSVEYNHKFHLGLYPGKYFNYQPHHEDGHADKKAHSDERTPSAAVVESALPANIPMYFSFYFVMTGIHGSHVLIGMGLILWAMIRLKRGDFGPNHYTFVEGVALFWHLVDLVWIYLFPLLYLV